MRTIRSEKDVDGSGGTSIYKFVTGEQASKYQIYEPMGVAVSEDTQRVYVSDAVQSTILVFDFGKKTASRITGGLKPVAGPMGIALDQDENIYVAETGRGGVRVFDKNGKDLRQITTQGMQRPIGVAIDKKRGLLYVVDSGRVDSEEHTVKVFDLEGKLIRKIGKQIGDAPGSFLFPTYISVDSQGFVYVADTLNARVQKFDPEGKVLMEFGKRGNAYGEFDKPKGVTVDSLGLVYVVDTGWNNVQMFTPGGDVLMYFGGRGTAPGLFQNPSAMTIDSKNNIYVADVLNHRVNVFRLINTTAQDVAAIMAEAEKANAAALAKKAGKK